jgi:hypothetical protein
MILDKCICNDTFGYIRFTYLSFSNLSFSKMKLETVSLLKALRKTAVALGGTLVSVVAILGLTYGVCLLKRPARSPAARSLFQGVDYQRYSRQTPRPLMFHVVTIDLTAPGIGFLATPQGIDPGGKETVADTVPGFLQKHGVQVAINASYFYPMYVHTPFDYAPRVGEGVNIVGLTISNGDRYSPVEPDWAALCIVSPQSITISEKGDCGPNTAQAVAGDRYFLKNARMVSEADSNEYFPRTVVALDKAHRKMWLVIVDGRQKGYSEGVTLAELATELIALGAYEAINLDGGGSTAIAVQAKSAVSVLNSPIQARVPMHQRPVANHLGIYARPLERKP